ncbi:hypothetical protein [Thomasclavelia sp.]
MTFKIKQKIKLFIFIMESIVLITLTSIMIFTFIHNGSLFSIFHINDKSEHLIYQNTISNNTLSIYEIGEPVLFEESHIAIKDSSSGSSIRLSIDNNGKKLTNKNVNITWKNSIPHITIRGVNQKEISYMIQ